MHGTLRRGDKVVDFDHIRKCLEDAEQRLIHKTLEEVLVSEDDLFFEWLHTPAEYLLAREDEPVEGNEE